MTAPAHRPAKIAVAAAAIEIRLENLSQLFDTMDPYPFRERDLSKEADEYIRESVGDLPSTALINIVVHLPEEEAQTESARSLGQALHRFFAYREQMLTRELKELFRVGRKALLVSIAILFACSALAQSLSVLFERSFVARHLQEGLTILGWVANWGPMEIFLFDWWPIVKRRNVYRRLMESTTTIMTYFLQPPDSVRP
jgi:hypothetical protein